MQRHPALQDLSRDHFVALNHVVAAKRILEHHASAEPLDAVWQRFVTWAGGPLMDHFAEEEELLVPLADGADLTELSQRLDADHARLRHAIDEMRTAPPDLQTLCNVTEDLRIHIRWEESELFEGLQNALSPLQLAALEAAADRFRTEAGLPTQAAR